MNDHVPPAVSLLLLIALPILAAWGFLYGRRRLIASGLPDPPIVRFFVVLCAYTTLLLLGVSHGSGRWSALHSVAAALLVVPFTPWLVVQGSVTLVRGASSPWHRVIAALSLAFPLVLVGVYFLIVAP